MAALCGGDAAAGVRHVLLTGPPGIGKTTIVRAALDAWSARGWTRAGFVTQEIREAGQRVGFEIVAVDGRCATLARREAGGSARVGKFRVFPDAVRDVAVDSLAAAGGDGLVVVDEIGRMELLCEGFAEAAVAALDAAALGISTVPSKAGLPAVDAAKRRPDVVVVEVTRANREALRAAVCDALVLARSSGGALDAAALRRAAEAETSALTRPPAAGAESCGPLGDAATARRLLLGEWGSARIDGAPPYSERSFWELLGPVFDVPPDDARANPAAVLAKARLVVWDVYATPHDASRRRPKVPNDLGAFLAAHPHCTTVLVNGKGALRAYRALEVPAAAAVLALPSSNARAIASADARARALAAWAAAFAES